MGEKRDAEKVEGLEEVSREKDELEQELEELRQAAEGTAEVAEKELEAMARQEDDNFLFLLMALILTAFVLIRAAARQGSLSCARMSLKGLKRKAQR